MSENSYWIMKFEEHCLLDCYYQDKHQNKGLWWTEHWQQHKEEDA